MNVSKLILNLLVLSFGIGSSAHAWEKAIDCMTWTLTTENDVVSQGQANAIAQSIVANGAAFGFVNISQMDDGSTTSFDFRYDRSSVMNDPGLLAKYERELKFLAGRTPDSPVMYGRSFDCTLEVPGPRPRLSGSN